MGTTIGGIDVLKKYRRQGYSTAILEDLRNKGGTTAFRGSAAGAAMMKKAGMKPDKSGRFVFPEKEE